MPPERAGERIFTLHFTKNDASHSPVVIDFHVDSASSNNVRVMYYTDLTRSMLTGAEEMNFTLAEARHYWKRYQRQGAVRIQN